MTLQRYSRLHKDLAMKVQPWSFVSKTFWVILTFLRNEIFTKCRNCRPHDSHSSGKLMKAVGSRANSSQFSHSGICKLQQNASVDGRQLRLNNVWAALRPRSAKHPCPLQRCSQFCSTPSIHTFVDDSSCSQKRGMEERNESCPNHHHILLQGAF